MGAPPRDVPQKGLQLARSEHHNNHGERRHREQPPDLVTHRGALHKPPKRGQPDMRTQSSTAAGRAIACANTKVLLAFGRGRAAPAGTR